MSLTVLCSAFLIRTLIMIDCHFLAPSSSLSFPVATPPAWTSSADVEHHVWTVLQSQHPELKFKWSNPGTNCEIMLLSRFVMLYISGICHEHHQLVHLTVNAFTSKCIYIIDKLII